MVTLAVALMLAPNALARQLSNRVMYHIERKESAELAKLVDPLELKKLNLSTGQAEAIIETVVLPKTTQLGVTKKLSDSNYINTGPWGSAYLFYASTPRPEVTHSLVAIYGPDQKAYISLSGLVISNWRTEERMLKSGYSKHALERSQLKSLGMTAAYMPFNGGMFPL